MKSASAVLALLLSIHSMAGHAAENYLQAPDRVEWEAGGLYEGRFEDGTRFQITLPYGAPAKLTEGQRDALRAAYWYPRHYEGTPIPLSNVRHNGRTVHLDRYSAGDRQVDETFTLTLSPDGARAEGHWNSASLRKRLAFTLERAIAYRGVAVTRPFKSPEPGTEDEQRMFEYAAVYPQLGDAAADAWIRRRVGSCSADLTCDMKMTVTWRGDGLLSLDDFSWTYGYGAAHGNGGSSSRHYLVKQGGLREVGLDHFIRPATECRARISRTLVDTLRKRKFSWPEQGALSAKWKPAFTATPKGIAFHYNVYHVGSYAEGPTSVFVPLKRDDPCVSFLPAAGQP